MPSSYLQRLRERRELLALKRQIVFSLGCGWLLLIFCGFRYLYVTTAPDRTCLALIGAGGLFFLSAMFWPRAVKPIEHCVRIGTGFIGKLLLATVLTAVYFAVVTPVGFIWRLTRGTGPFHAWQETPPAGMEGWSPKAVIVDDRRVETARRKRPLLLQPIIILSYFFRYGHFVLLPVLLVLLLCGLILLFVKSSALAPFIYTLF